MGILDVLRDPTKKSWYMVEFSYNDDGTDTGRARYTNWNAADLHFIGVFLYYISTPNMSVKIPENNGTFDDKPLEVILPRDNGGFADKVSSGIPFPPIKVIVYEVTLDPTTSDDSIDPAYALTVYRGKVSRAVRNYQGRTATVKVEATTTKGSLSIPLGITANDQCSWTFGESYGAGGFIGCKRGGLKQLNHQIAAINRKAVTMVSAVLPPAGFPGGNGKHYHRGYLEFGELRIGIRDWSSAAPKLFQMVREPPAFWVGASVNIMPGCDKTLATCRDRWLNEVNFGGLGCGMPNYNPLLEGPPK